MQEVRTMQVARWLFVAAGVYGVFVLFPLYFLEGNIASMSGSFTHPEYYYGFIGTALSAQFMFFVIAWDPSRFRPAMLFAVLEKLAFAIPVLALVLSSRVAGSVVAFGAIDFIWALVFAGLWAVTRGLRAPAGTSTRSRAL